MSKGKLPQEFSGLEPHAHWGTPTERDFLAKRDSTSDEDIKVFYDAMMPRFKEIVAYLNKFPMDKMPEDATVLYRMARSLMELGALVENGRSRHAWRFDIKRFVQRHEPLPEPGRM